MGQHPIVIAGQQRQQLELLGREPDLGAVADHPAAVVVDGRGRRPGARPTRPPRRVGDAARAPRGSAPAALRDRTAWSRSRRRRGRAPAPCRLSEPRADSTTIGTVEVVADAPADLGALDVRQPEVEHDQVGRHASATGAGHRRRCRPPRPRSRGCAAAAPTARWIAPRRRRAGCAAPAVTPAPRRRPAALRRRRNAMVNRAPPSGRFSAQTRPPCTASSPRAIHRPIPVPEVRPSRPRAAEEALEEVRQVRGRDARARDRAPRRSARRATTRRHVDGRVRRARTARRSPAGGRAPRPSAADRAGSGCRARW